MLKKKIVVITALIAFSIGTNAQLVAVVPLKKADTDTTSKTDMDNAGTLVIGTEFRTRTELRYGYRQLPSNDTLAAFFTIQRMRLNLDYKSKKLDLYASLQDARTWGAIDPRNPTVPISFFEAYAEPKISDKISFRIGRQRILYDNQRLFAENDWRNTANAHDAFRFIYDNKTNLVTEFISAFNQTGENVFTTRFSPSGFTNYKTLNVHYLNYKINNNWNLITLNTMDGYQSSQGSNAYKTTFMRFTSGGHLEYANDHFAALLHAYYQYGKDSSGKKLSAYFLNPEIKYTKNAFSVRLGAEVMSGQDATKPNGKERSFVALYGVAHRFNGNLDFFTSFPGDLNNAGLVNPYLFFWYQKGKVYLRVENHLFYSQNNFVKDEVVIKKYLGFENDCRVNYKFSNITELEAGACWAAVSNSMVDIKKSGDAATTPWWTYISFKFTPQLGKFIFDK